jgi:hypothetical protein
VCYSVPEWFREKLHSQSSGRLRIRWSPKREAWQIEQKISRPIPPYRFDFYDDSYIRFKDGYNFLMEVQPGDRMPCPTCGLTVKIKAFVNMESTCTNCRSKGRDGRVPGCYYPLGEALLEHLRKGSPENGGIERIVKESDEHNRKLMKSKRQDSMNEIEAATKDNFTRLFEIQSVGYTGKEFK